MSYRTVLALSEENALEKTELPESDVCNVLLSGL